MRHVHQKEITSIEFFEICACSISEEVIFKEESRARASVQMNRLILITFSSWIEDRSDIASEMSADQSRYTVSVCESAEHVFLWHES